MKKDYPWLNRNVINFSYEKFLTNREYFKYPVVRAPRVVDNGGETNKGGRPKGATSEAKRNLKITFRDALNEIAVEYQKEMNTAKSLGFQAKKGCLEDLIIQKKAEFSISDDV